MGGHEEQNGTSVHEMRRFCGYEQQNDANFQEKGCFLGYEGEFDDNELPRLRSGRHFQGESVEIDFLDEEDYFKISSNCFYVMYANDWKH